MSEALARAFAEAGIPQPEAEAYAAGLVKNGVASLEAVAAASKEELVAAGLTLMGHRRLVVNVAQRSVGKVEAPVAAAQIDEINAALKSNGLDDEAAAKCSQALAAEGFTTLASLAKVDENDLKACGITLRMHIKAILSLKPNADDNPAKHARFEEAPSDANDQAAAQPPVDSDVPSHSSYVLSLMFSPNGEYIASGSYDDSIKLWSNTGEELAVLRAHSKAVLAVAFSSSGQNLVSASKDMTVKLWDVATREVRRTFNGHSNRVLCATFAKNDSIIISGSEDKSIIFWSTGSGTVIRRCEGHKGGVTSVAVSSDETLFASSSGDRSVRIWSMDTGELVRTLSRHTGGVQSVVFVKGKNQVVSGSKDETAVIWDALSGVALTTLVGHAKWIDCVAVFGDYIATASGDNSVRIWDFSGRCLKILVGHVKDVRCVCFSPDGKFICSGADDKCIRLWQFEP